MHIVHWNGGVGAFDKSHLMLNAAVRDALYPGKGTFRQVIKAGLGRGR